MGEYNISGIQQVGIGVSNLEESWYWYAKHFGMDLPIFNDEAEAALMTNYTGGKVHQRKAVLAMNLQGGGGFEVWQFTSRSPDASPKVSEGDLGISSVHMRTKNVNKAWEYFSALEDIVVSDVLENEMTNKYFNLSDPFGNQFKIIEDEYQFMTTQSVTGGVLGVTFGVSDMEESLKLFQEVFKYDQLLSRTKVDGIERAWIKSNQRKASAFSELLGPTCLELVCDTNTPRTKIFDNRYWGDEGFIHCCFDVQKISELRTKSKEEAYPFTVDSENSFDMGEAAGQFAYIETKDGTLIELVETHKVPILKKLGWYINLKNKKTQKPLPSIIFKVLGKKRIKC